MRVGLSVGRSFAVAPRAMPVFSGHATLGISAHAEIGYRKLRGTLPTPLHKIRKAPKTGRPPSPLGMTSPLRESKNFGLALFASFLTCKRKS